MDDSPSTIWAHRMSQRSVSDKRVEYEWRGVSKYARIDGAFADFEHLNLSGALSVGAVFSLGNLLLRVVEFDGFSGSYIVEKIENG